MDIKEAESWLFEERSMHNCIPSGPDHQLNTALADAAMVQTAYYTMKAHREFLTTECKKDDKPPITYLSENWTIPTDSDAISRPRCRYKMYLDSVGWKYGTLLAVVGKQYIVLGGGVSNPIVCEIIK